MPPSYLHLRLSRNDRPKRGSWRFEYAKRTGQRSRIDAVERTREASYSLSSIAYEIRQALNRLCEVRRCLGIGGKSEKEGVAVPAVYLAEFGDVALKRGWGAGKDGAQVESRHLHATHVSGNFLFDDVHHGWRRQSYNVFFNSTGCR